MSEVANQYNLVDCSLAHSLKKGYLVGLIENIEVASIALPRITIRALDNGISQLADSISKNGLLQPIVVRPRSDSFFELVAGNRRLHACKYLRWRKIPCHVIELDDKEAYELSLVENVHRRSMDPVTEALAYKRYISEFGWGSAQDLAKKIGKSSSYISKRLSILDLPADVLDLVRSREISVTIAEELAPLNEDKELQSHLARLVASRNLSMRKVRTLVSEEFVEIATTGSNTTPSPTKVVPLKDGREQKQREAEITIGKATIALRLALNTIGQLIDEVDEDNWALRELLMGPRSILHTQVDVMIRQRKRSKHFYSTRRRP